MKRFLSFFLTVIMLISIAPMKTFAINRNTLESDIGYFDDGSYIIIELQESPINSLSTNTVTKTKVATFYDTNNNKEWVISLTGTFTYTGSSSTCTNATSSYTIYENSWKVTSKTTSKSGNKAKCDYVVKRYFLGVPVKTIEKSLSLTCSNTGVCS